MDDRAETISPITRRTWFGVSLTSLSGIMGLGGSAWLQAQGKAPPAVRVVIDAQAVPTHVFNDSAEITIPLSALSAHMGARIRKTANAADKLTVTLGDYTVQFQLDSRRLLARADPEKSTLAWQVVKTPPRRWKGEIWIPLSLIRLLGATVSEVSAGTIAVETQDQETPAVWRRLIGLPENRPPEDKNFRISHLKITSVASVITPEKVIVLNVTLTSPGWVQVYEINKESISPLFGRFSGKEVVYPLLFGGASEPMRLESPLHFQLQAGEKGIYRYVALASTEAIMQDPREILKGGDGPGKWAIAGTTCEIH